MLPIFILLIIGFILLIKGADFLVNGSSSLAKNLGVSSLFFGLTIVAFSTSAPELTVSIIASLQNKNEIIIGNILGSNIANILFVLGFSAIIYPLTLTKKTVLEKIPIAGLSVLLLALISNNFLTNDFHQALISRFDGLILLIFFILFLINSSKTNQEKSSDPKSANLYSRPKSLIMIVVGLAGLILGAKLIVNSAVTLARILNLSEALIGLTIIALGTSLPELATSAVAAYKKQSDIAVGNIIGSNIFNVFFVLGISAFVNPIPFSPILLNDIFITFGVTFLLFISIFVGKKYILKRWQGICFISLYFVYLFYLVLRG